MSINPYETPVGSAQRVIVGFTNGDREYLKRVIRCQRRILICLSLHLIFVGLTAAARSAQALDFVTVSYVGLLITWVTAAALVFVLAMKLYSRRAAVLLGFFAAIPILGLAVLLIVQLKANSTLWRKGIDVGFLGVLPSHIERSTANL